MGRTPATMEPERAAARGPLKGISWKGLRELMSRGGWGVMLLPLA